jgi:hypothetical protein
MTLAFFYSMIQGGLILVNEFTYTFFFARFWVENNRKAKVMVHYYIQWFGTIFYFLAFIAIFANKTNTGKTHFTTWHSWFGLFTILFSCFGQLFLGSLMYVPRLGNLLGLCYKVPNNIVLKKWHRILAALSFSIGLITIILALSSNFVVSGFGESIRVLLAVLITVLLIFVPLVTLRFSPLSVFCPQPSIM